MKKIFFIILGILFFIFVTGCEKYEDPITEDPIDTTVVPVTQYTITTSILSGMGKVDPLGTVQVDSAYSKTIIVTPDPGFDADSIFVDGVKVPLTNYRYRIYPALENHDIKVTFDTLLLWDLFSKGSWQEDSIIEYQSDGDIIRAPAWDQDCEGCHNIEYNFFSDGNMELILDGRTLNPTPYTLDETKNPPILKIGASFEVLKLTEEELWLKSYSPGYYWVEKFTHHYNK